MSDNTMLMPAQILEQAIRSGIPISAQMDFKVRELSAQSICVSGGASENINVHNTAFAGSLYSICTLAAWGLTFSKLPKRCSLVMAKASIEYLRPVKGKILAQAELSDDQVSQFLEQLDEQEVKVMDAQQLAVKFTAQLYVKNES